MYALITGASRGIGKNIAEVFARNGYDLLITSKSAEAIDVAKSELSEKYPSINIAAAAFDLSIRQSAEKLCQWAVSIAVPDVLINNAGVFAPGSIADEPDGILENQIATNLYSAYYVTKGLLPPMIAEGRGHIFNMCSIASLRPYKNGGAYSISKYALYGFNQNLREELKPHGIKVTAVFPGAVFTDSWRGFDNSTGRIMLPDDIATMIFAAAQLSPQACVEDIIIRPQQGDL